MVSRGRRWAVPVGALAAVSALAWALLHRSAPSPAPDARAAGAPRAGNRPEAGVPRIDLARLDRPRPATGIGRRDIFDFGVPPTPPPPPVAAATPPPPVAEDTLPPVAVAPTPPPAPPMSVKYIGSFEGKQGLKVAVLMTDRREVLTGQAGEVVANRLRIVRIGLESVDVQDVGSEQVRRIPLKGN